MINLRYIFILIFIVFAINTFSQVSDNFDYNDFTENPEWIGDTSQFKINSSNQLQLNSSVADTSYLSTANTLINDIKWEFWVKQSFNSSANNHSRVYLVSDKVNLEDSLNGYYIQIGGSNDSLGFFKQTGNIH